MTKEGIKPFAPTGYRTLNPRTAMFYYATGITPAMIMRLTNIGSQYLGAFVDSPACPFWAHRRRPLEPPAAVLTAIASYREDQWEALLATVADRDELEATWEQWNAGIEKLIAGLEARSIPYVTFAFCWT